MTSAWRASRTIAAKRWCTSFNATAPHRVPASRRASPSSPSTGRPAAEVVAETMDALSRYWGYSSERYLRYNAHRWFLRRHTRGDPVRLVLRDGDGAEQSVILTADLRAGYQPRLPVPKPGIPDSGSVSW